MLGRCGQVLGSAGSSSQSNLCKRVNVFLCKLRLAVDQVGRRLVERVKRRALVSYDEGLPARAHTHIMGREARGESLQAVPLLQKLSTKLPFAARARDNRVQ